MSIWFVDPQSGIDSNSSAGNGDSFATRRKTIGNLTAASLVPGDEVRVMKSADATSIGSATWTSGPNPANVSIASSTNATPIVITSSGDHGRTTGDTVLIYNHGTNTNANGVWKVNVLAPTTFELLNEDGTNSTGNGVGGLSGTITKISIVRLASALTKNIACHGNRGAVATWTASADVTTSIQQTTYKEGGECPEIAIGSAFTTGLAAYTAFSSQDFSSYQQISFVIRQISGTTMTAGDLQLSLCSDAVGATPVDTFNVPANGALNTWFTVTVDKGSALGAAIQSIALYVTADRGAQTFRIDNIIACKAPGNDAITLNSLIGKATGGFYPIQSINGTRIIFDAGDLSLPTSTAYSRGYYGTAESVTTYKRECHKLAIATGAFDALNQVNDSGTSGSPITITGGWNDTDMTTQTGQSYFDGCNGYGVGLLAQSLSYLSGFDNLAFYRYYQGVRMPTCNNIVANFLAVGGCQNYGALLQSTTDSDITVNYILNNNTGLYPPTGSVFTATEINNNQLYGVELDSACTYAVTNCNNNFHSGFLANGDNSNVFNVTNCKGNGTANFNISNASDTIINDCSMSGFGTDILTATMTVHPIVFNNCTFGGTTPIGSLTNSYSQHGGVYCQKYGQTADDHRQFLNNGTIMTDALVHSTSAYSWKLSPTTTTYCYDRNPFKMAIAQVQVAAEETTVTCWFRRTNAAISARLVCKGGQLLGVSEVVDTMTAAQDTWEQLSLTFTPTEGGVVEITAECFGGTTHSVYVDDFAKV